jgi:GNAT superfamily N-acetyltransferase
VATVIARVLPAFRGRGIGAALYERGLAHARGLGAGAVETVVLAANEDGLRFAGARGFTERERYVLDGESDEWVDLRLAAGT